MMTFIADFATVIDLNECLQGVNGNFSQKACSENSVCVNTLGSFACMKIN